MCRFDYVLTGTRGRSTKTGKLCRHGAFHVCGGEEFARPPHSPGQRPNGTRTAMSSPVSVLEQYTELKHLVRSHEQHAAEIKAIKATAAAEVLSARAEADGARAAMDAAMQELNKLKAEVAALRNKQRERKSAAESSKSAAASAAADAAKQDAARFTTELGLFREAAAADVLEAKLAAQAEHAAAEAKWAADAEVMRRHAATRSERHAARLRDVIASEEAWRASVVTLEGRLRAIALLALSLCVRAFRAERARTTHQTHECTLAIEVRQMDRRLVATEEARQASAAGAALATAAAETEVRALRTQIKNVVRRQRAQQLLLAERSEYEVRTRVQEEVCRVRDELLAEAEAREAQHEVEMAAVQSELSEARTALSDFERSVAETLSKQGRTLLAELEWGS